MKKNQVDAMKARLNSFKNLYIDYLCDSEFLDPADSIILNLNVFSTFICYDHYFYFNASPSTNYICRFSFNKRFIDIYSKCCGLIVKRCEEVLKTLKI